MTENHNYFTGIAKKYKRIDHIAIAVVSLDKALSMYVGVLGFTFVERRVTTGLVTAMESAVLQGNGYTIVLLQGTEPQSQITQYIEQYGPGVQHIAFEVDDLEEIVKELTENGIQFSTQIIKGGNLKQIFTKRDCESGMMFEFIERYGEGFEENNINSLFRQLEETQQI
ncbi:VOC family protein [Xenorhabdus bovienii]|uniref:VOC family protein n=1 Tax=Xenorhabdus bovienii TaxID=40576 RepID=A0AAJ1J421_XENBV|nr:VOC family protein [Xenorhabdus bovienii]MDE1476884.1 VOC family protein [Xenorhabdus bovienii]MDE1485101.1 VOC family protein [Xenorhabdus bovienii]MDE1494196.1 VOC family protein [Xenorhabdus bovienii]MDE9430271.1 VOC family protein [Xenorhabdus bovienii]MDE9444926.1 VOC family protein [Xenorhabdus bovienii]